MNKKKFAIIGGGSWGTALACMLARVADHAMIYTKEQKIVDEINQHHTNSKYLQDTILCDNVQATNDFSDIINYEMIVIAVPSRGFNNIIHELQRFNLPKSTILLIASKGMSPDPLQFFSEKINLSLENPFAFIHGPNFAKEVAMGQKASITVACQDQTICHYIVENIKSPQMNVEHTDDIMTVQIASMVKNIFAIKSGIMQAQGEGENIRASLISQALNEIKILSAQFGGRSESLSLAAVAGDLVLTCYSQTSRNTKFGYEFHNNGYEKGFINNYPILVEGVQSAKLLKKFTANMRINLPIIDEIASLVQV